LERTEIAHEYRDLIRAANTKKLPEIEVTERVMGRIAELDGSRRSFSRRTLRSSTALSGVFVLLLLLSVTAYAASEYIQIRNNAGTVKVQFVPPDNVTGSANSYDKYAKQAQAFAKPGELIAYYVKGKQTAGASATTLRFAYKEKPLKSYADFAEEMKRTNAPELPKVIRGYTFDSGSVSPSIPTTDAEKQGSVYRNTLHDLTSRASRATDGENAFMKTIPWSIPGAISGYYSKGKARIGIFATLLHNGKMFVEQQEKRQADIVQIAGTDVIYNREERPNATYEYLNWYDEGQDAYFTLASYGKTLNKEQLLQVAGDLIATGEK